MFDKIKAGFKPLFKGFNNISSTNDMGPLSFFSNWFNPNNLVGELQQLEQYRGITYACVSAIAEDVAKIKFTMNRPQKDGTMVPVTDHDFLKLLKNPNPTQSDYEFMEMTQTHIELTGEAFWYVPKGSISSKPKELWIMRPDLVQVVFSQDTGEVSGYVFHKFNGRQQIPLSLDEVIHFKMPNPINPYRGMGTVEAGIVYIQTEEFSAKFSRNFLANNATPAGIINFKGTIPDPEFQKIKRQWTREYGNVENAGKTAFVRSADVTYQKIGSSLQDIDLKELKNLTRDDIMFMFRVSKPILGITEDVNYSNAQTAEYIFAKRVIDPKMNRICDILQTFYNAHYKDGLNVSYITPIPQNTDEKIAYYKAGINSFLTPNEVRSSEGLEPIDGGDSIRMPFNLVAISSNTVTAVSESSNNGTSASGTDGGGGTKAKIIKRTITTTVRKKDGSEEKVDVSPSALEKTKEDFRVLMVNTREAYIPQLVSVTRDIVSTQRNAILTQVKSFKKKDANDPDTFNPDSINYDTATVSLNLAQAYEPILMELMKEAGKYASQIVDPELKFELQQQSIARLKERTATVAADYSVQTQEALAKMLTTAMEEGWALPKIRKQVEEIFGDATGYRADRIARTEAAHEANAATLDAYVQSGYVVQKEWYAGGLNPCQFCLALDGKVVETEEVFVSKGGTVDGVDGGKYLADYQDTEAGDLHPNCQCTILPVRE